MRRSRTILVALVGFVLGAWLSPLAASAATSPAFQARNIEPGWSDSENFEIHNDNSQPSALSLFVDDIADDDSSCTSTSSAAACGQGQLGQELLFTAVLDRNDGRPASTVWHGNVYDLAQRVSLDQDMPAGATWQLRLTAGLPITAGNETQGDSLSFNLEAHLQGDVVQVLGTTFFRNGSSNTSTTGPLLGVLPFTGSFVLPLFLTAVILLTVGAALLRARHLLMRR